MKTIKLIGLLLMCMMLVNGCRSRDHFDLPIHTLERLFFIFQDADGNDLLKELGLEFNEWGVFTIDRQSGVGVFYTEYPDERMNLFWTSRWHGGIPSSEPYFSFGVANTSWASGWSIADGAFYVLVFSQRGTNAWNVPPAEWITYRVQFPALFGNDEVYEIVTYWRVITPNWAFEAESYCYRVVFNGQEFTPTRHYIPRSEECIEKFPDAGTHGTYFSVVTIVLDRD